MVRYFYINFIFLVVYIKIKNYNSVILNSWTNINLLLLYTIRIKLTIKLAKSILHKGT